MAAFGNSLPGADNALPVCVRLSQRTKMKCKPYNNSFAARMTWSATSASLRFSFIAILRNHL